MIATDGPDADDWAKEPCDCGDARYWHSSNGRGACEKTRHVNGHRKPCRCGGFQPEGTAAAEAGPE